MNDALINDIDTWIDLATKATLAFWRADCNCFWRDTKEMEAENPHDYYPTATFLCTALLHNVTDIPVVTKDETAFSCISFLKHIESLGGVDKIITRSDVVSFQEKIRPWNIYTASWSVKALVAVYNTLKARGTIEGLTEADMQKYIQQITENIATQAEAISKHLNKHKGAVLKEGNRPHPFLTFSAFDALSRAVGIKCTPSNLWDQTNKDALYQKAETESHKIISLSVLECLTPSDLVGLVYHAHLLSTSRIPAFTELMNHSVDLVSKWQSEMGGWPLGRSLLYAPGGHGLQVSSFDVGASLVEVSHLLAEHSKPSLETTAVRDTAFISLFRSIERSLSKVKVGENNFDGWCNENVYGHDVAESWTTALVLRFLKSFRSYSQMRLQQQRLQQFDTKWPNEMEDWVKWDDIEEPDSEHPILTFIESRFLNSLCGNLNVTASLPSKAAKNISMILFGPPGTSKTTIVRAIAKKLEWPLVYITPSLFLSKGLDSIDSQANAIFSDLQKLERVLIFFDECDELFRVRPVNTKEISMAALITGAMLPRLQDLHDRGKLIFIIATNRLRSIDPAVKRQGRFDYLIAVGPPDHVAIEKLFQKHCSNLPTACYQEVAKSMVRFTRDEVIRAIASFDALFRDNPETSKDQLLESVKRKKDSQALIIEDKTWDDFNEDKPRYSHPSQPF